MLIATLKKGLLSWKNFFFIQNNEIPWNHILVLNAENFDTVHAFTLSDYRIKQKYSWDIKNLFK